ncbi:MAG: hypothetical protein M1527_05325 [Gammaproteobacteria bacterium]|nr:hypothetical protein [Gammaproteobacteria bacterium]
MHPVIRLTAFLALCALLARAAWSQVFATAVLLGLLYHLANVPLRTGLAALKRLRWLLVSLILLHLAFTPGVPLFPGLFSIPTQEGIEEGLLRASLLALLMLAAHLLIQSTPREALLAALLWLSAPLARLGFAREQLALRVMLTLHAVSEVQDLVRAAAPDQHSTRLARITQRASLLWENVLQHAESAPCVTLDIPACGAPPLRQWFYLLLAGSLLWALGAP